MSRSWSGCKQLIKKTGVVPALSRDPKPQMFVVVRSWGSCSFQKFKPVLWGLAFAGTTMFDYLAHMPGTRVRLRRREHRPIVLGIPVLTTHRHQRRGWPGQARP